MKKNAMWMVLAVLVGMTAQVMAVTFTELLADEKAAQGATHVAIFKNTDFASVTSTNVSYTNALAVAAKTGMELVYFRLKTAFDTANTNHTGSVALKVGDAGDDDRYLASTELASDGTEVWGGFGRTTWNSTADQTNVIFAYSPIFYTTATNVNFIFTPNAQEALGSNTVGEVRLYFRVLRP